VINGLNRKTCHHYATVNSQNKYWAHGPTVSGTSKDVALATIRSLSIVVQQGLSFKNEKGQPHPVNLGTARKLSSMTLAAANPGKTISTFGLPGLTG